MLHTYVSILLIKGTTLMNTEWVYGIVVYTGADTKSVLNSSYSSIPCVFSYSTEKPLQNFQILNLQ